MNLQTFQPSGRLTEPPITLRDGVTLFWRTVRDFAKGIAGRLPHSLVGSLVFTLFWVLGKLLKKGINQVAAQSDAIDDMLANLVSRIVGTLITIFGFLAACVVIFPSFKPGDILAGLGITSVIPGSTLSTVIVGRQTGVANGLVALVRLLSEQVRPGWLGCRLRLC